MIPSSRLHSRDKPGPPASGGKTDGAELQVGRVLGKLLLTERLGAGAMGVVFRAFHQSLGIPVAVKILRAEEVEADPSLYEQLKSEARLLAQLNHPNVVRVWDFEDHPRHPYLVLDLIEGLSLAELIQQCGRLQLDRAADIILQAAEGLAAALAIGVIHRDVKPANILLTRTGTAKLADFGLAVVSNKGLLAQGEGKPASSAPAGTPAYMAPEQFYAPEAVDHRSDIYSLGATFYHAVTGRVPFEGRTVREVLRKQAQDAFVPPHEIVPGLPPAVAHVLRRMMAKLQADRYQSYEELIAGLAEVHTPTPLPAPLDPAGAAEGQGKTVRSGGASSTLAGRGAGGTPVPGLPGSDAGKNRSRSWCLNPVKLMREAIAAAKSGDRARARSLLRRAAQLNPHSELVWLWLAGLVETPAEAVRCFEHVLAINPANDHALQAIEPARLQAGIAAARAGDKEEARRHLRAAVGQNPASELGWLWLAGVAETSQEALRHLERVLAVNPRNERALAGIAWHRSRLPAQDAGSDTDDYVAVEQALRPCVLVLGADESARERVAAALEEHDYQVVRAAGASEGIALCREHLPDLVLIDIRLPGADGYQVCKAIKTDPVTSDIPVVLSGGDGDVAANETRGRIVGAAACVPGDSPPGELVQLVGRHRKRRN
jgi:serine/threonine protein kinase/CheY-like chemotaxis protein